MVRRVGVWQSRTSVAPAVSRESWLAGEAAVMTLYPAYESQSQRWYCVDWEWEERYLSCDLHCVKAN